MEEAKRKANPCESTETKRIADSLERIAGALDTLVSAFTKTRTVGTHIYPSVIDSLLARMNPRRFDGLDDDERPNHGKNR